MRPRFRSTLRLLIASILTGVVAGGFAILFRMALANGLQHLVGSSDVTAGFASIPVWKRLLLPAVGGLLAALVRVVAVRGTGHAMADVMEAVTLGRGGMSMRMVLTKSLASFSALVTGGSLGREGSILQFGAAAGDWIGDRAQLTARQRRSLLAGGTAAGFAAAYNTPIAAIVFVLEVITGVVDLELLLPVIVGTTIATVLTRTAIGGVPLYGQRSFALASEWELVAHAVLGVLAGLAGPAFMAMLFGVEDEVGRVRRWPAARVAVAAAGGLGVGLLAIGFPEVAGNGFEAIQQTLDGELAGAFLLALLVAKALATVSSVSTGSPGGVFTPSMFLGAALGGAYASALAHLFPGIGPTGGYALVGMAAMLAATTHAPLMAGILGFELSGDYAIVLPLLLATGLGSFVSRWIRTHSVYTEELRRRGIAWHGSLGQRLAQAVHAKDLLEQGAPVLAPDAPIDAGLEVLDQGARAVYVSGPQMKVLDCEKARSLLACRERGQPIPATVADAAKPITTARPEADLLELSETLWHMDHGQIPVVAKDGSFLGVVSRRAVLGAIDREVLDREVLLTRIVRFEDGGADYLELPRGWVSETVAVPPGLAGKPARPGELRERLGVIVVGVRPRGRGGIVRVDGVELHAHDQLVVVGPPEAIVALRALGTA